MKTQMIILVALMTGACATPYQRCMSPTSNPFEVDIEDQQGTLERLYEIKQSKYPKMTNEQFTAMVNRSTRMEWHAYGSVQACVNAKDHQDAVAINNVAVGYNLGRDAVRNNQSETDGLNAHLAEFAKGRPAVVQPTEVNVYIRK